LHERRNSALSKMPFEVSVCAIAIGAQRPKVRPQNVDLLE
jgi:hypothetical protein